MTVSLKELMEQDEFWIMLFVLGLFLLNWPILSLVAGDATLFGYPLTLVYILMVWTIIVIIIYVYDRCDFD
jgi:hypothetical protein